MVYLFVYTLIVSFENQAGHNFMSLREAISAWINTLKPALNQLAYCSVIAGKNQWKVSQYLPEQLALFRARQGLLSLGSVD